MECLICELGCDRSLECQAVSGCGWGGGHVGTLELLLGTVVDRKEDVSVLKSYSWNFGEILI